MSENLTLTEFLAKNSVAQAKLKQKLEAEYQVGFAKCKEEIEAKITRAFKFSSADSKYPVAVQNMAIEVVKGETSIDAFEAVVKMEDMRIEREKSEGGKEDSDDADDTPGDPGQKSEDGKIRTEADYKAMMTKLKKTKGMK